MRIPFKELAEPVKELAEPVKELAEPGAVPG